MALHYTVSADQLPERDIYEITPVASLKEFLRPEQSLCIVRCPFDGEIVEMTRVMGKSNLGEPVKVYLESASLADLGYYKCKLDKSLHSPYLFISWKKGHHTFKLIDNHEILAEYPDFDSACAAYFSDGFIPENSYRRSHTAFELMCRTVMRRSRLSNLLRILKEYGKKKKA